MVDSSTNNEIYINDGEISLLFNDKNEGIIDSSMLPIIQLENANIHNAYGNWTSNLEWTIKEIVDLSTGNTLYKVKNQGKYKTDAYYVTDGTVITLKPTSDPTITPYLKYSEKNNYGLPMIMMYGYEIYNESIPTDKTYGKYYNYMKSNVYILEIIKGDILFKEQNNVGAQLSFTDENMQ